MTVFLMCKKNYFMDKIIKACTQTSREDMKLLTIKRTEEWKTEWKNSNICSSYLFSDRGDKPRERRGERREQQMLDTKRTAASSIHHSLVECHDDTAHWCLVKKQQQKKNRNFCQLALWFWFQHFWCITSPII